MSFLMNKDETFFKKIGPLARDALKQEVELHEMAQFLFWRHVPYLALERNGHKRKHLSKKACEQKALYEEHRGEIKRAAVRSIFKSWNPFLSYDDIYEHLEKRAYSFHHRTPISYGGLAHEGCLLPANLHKLIHKDFDGRKQKIANVLKKHEGTCADSNPRLYRDIEAIEGVIIQGNKIFVPILDAGPDHFVPQLSALREELRPAALSASLPDPEILRRYAYPPAIPATLLEPLKKKFRLVA